MSPVSVAGAASLAAEMPFGISGLGEAAAIEQEKYCTSNT